MHNRLIIKNMINIMNELNKVASKVNVTHYYL